MRFFLASIALMGCQNVSAPSVSTAPLAHPDMATSVTSADLASSPADMAIAPDLVATPDLVTVADLSQPRDLTAPPRRVLRVLPIGDSITFGPNETTPTNPTYRGYLFDTLTTAGYLIDYVGGRSSGDATLLDKDNEGWPGWTTMTWLTIVNTSYNRRSNISVAVKQHSPDVTMIIAGTNDCYAGGSNIGGWEPESVPEQLGTMIHHAFVAAPNALILVGSIPPIPAKYYPLARACIDAANARIPSVVAYQRSQGVNVRYVDLKLTDADVMNALYGGNPGSTGGDTVHPNNVGYQHMAAEWAGAFIQYVSP